MTGTTLETYFAADSRRGLMKGDGPPSRFTFGPVHTRCGNCGPRTAPAHNHGINHTTKVYQG